MKWLWDELVERLQTAQAAVDGWVGRNVSRQTQTYLIMSLILAMVLHLVYTKRKMTREELARRAIEEKSKRKKDK